MSDRWRESFAAFLADMGPRPSPDHTLDRRDNDGPYDAENCRWVLRHVQNNNTRFNRHITIDGVTKSLTEWAGQRGLSPATVDGRIRRGWSIERAFTEPLHAKKRDREPGKTRSRFATINGVTKTVTEWAREFRLSISMVRNRIHNGWDPVVALTTPRDANQRMVTFHGETKSASEWARELGISEKLLHQRLGRGWSAERAFTQSKQVRHYDRPS
jgi:hypothetical protein